MPDNGDEKPFPVSREARTRGKGCLNEANDFAMRECAVYDIMGDNTAQSVYINGNGNTIVLAGNQPTTGTSLVQEQGPGVQVTNPPNYGSEIPVDQSSIGSRDEAPQITLVQPRAPIEASVAQDNGSNDDDLQIRPVQPPTEVHNGSRGEESQITPVHPPTALQTNSNVSLPPDPGIASEPEVKAEYTEPYAPSNSSTSYPHKSRARTHIYSFEMLTHRAGYPLYMPTPLGGLPTAYRKKGIGVGDVGVITANGAFDFLFNACESDQSINPDVLPDGFGLLKARIRTSEKFGPGECLPSDQVREISDGSLSAFHCLATEGAVLVLHKGATVYEAMNKADFQKHAGCHAISWYKYMFDEGLDVSNGSLYFVTECIKSAHWGIAVFYANPIPDDHLRFIVKEGSCRWEKRGKVESRIGPNPKDIIPFDDEEPNQCVFLRGYKIMLRSDVWDKLKGTMAVTTQDEEFSSSPSTRTTSFSPSPGKSGSQADPFYQSSSDNSTTTNSSYGTRLQESQHVHIQTLLGGPMTEADVSGPESLHDLLGPVTLEENFREEVPLHPSDLINLMLLSLKPEAKMALAHDSEWCDHLPPDFVADPVNPNIDGFLENIKRSCKVVIDENESAILVENEMESKAEVGSKGQAIASLEDLLNNFRDIDSFKTVDSDRRALQSDDEPSSQSGSEYGSTGTYAGSSSTGTYVDWSIDEPESDVLDGINKLASQTHSSFNSPQQRNIALQDQMQTDIPLHLQHQVVRWLLTLLKKEPIESISSKVNETTVGLMCNMLDLNDYGAISSELRLASDVKLLLDFILCLLDGNHLQELPMPDITRKARRFMFKLLAQRPVALRSLFITGVVTPDLNQVNYVGMGGCGLVFKGKYKGKHVALKVLYRGPHFNDLCREVLVWRSLSHPYILPLLGIFERESQIFLVSPYMENGTLAGWRRYRQQSIKDIRQRVLEVAEALQYIHSEGIVHGDLRGENILLDPSFRSQVADFGLTRHCDITLTRS
ncbi:hypothetical protein AX14_001856, partial [Amanita brunnescens Koide BX004]